MIACRTPGAYRLNVATRYARFLLWVGLGLSAPLLTGCGSASRPADSVESANQRLGGSWRLKNFSPATPLDLPLQGVLAAELGQLIVTFNQGQFSAVGPGIELKSRYQVTSASGDQVSVIVYDAHNVGYHFSLQFAGRVLQFQSNDKPWIGVGEFERA